MSDAPPPWLGELQASFAEALQAPLDAHTGTLRAPPDIPAALRDEIVGAQRLALYHEQYWMRLFTAMQSELPRFAQVVGYWHFNLLAMAYLRQHPPIHADLARCADGFAAHLLDAGVTRDALPPTVPIALAQQALRMDEAARRARFAPWSGIWRPTEAEQAVLLQGRLRFAPGWTLLREDWALADRAALADPPPPFLPHAQPCWWISYRAEHTTALRRIEPAFAKLVSLLATHPLGDALSALETTTRAPERLRAALPGWIHLALSSGWWVGVEPPTPSASARAR